MTLKKIKNISYKNVLWIFLILLPVIVFMFFIFDSVSKAHLVNKNIFAYTVKVRDSVEEIDKILERAEINVDVMSDSISSTYDLDKQKDKNYNLKYIKQIDGLVQSALVNSPGIDGAWFQLNSNLPFSASAYNWYEFKDNQFINLRNQFEGNESTANRAITPEDDPYYFGALGSKDATWSDLYTDPDTKNQMLTLSEPIYKDGTLVGVVGIDISTDSLKTAMQKIKLILFNSELYLLNNKNSLIMSLGLNNTEAEQIDNLFLNLSKNNGDGLLEYKNRQSKKTAIILTLSNKYKIIITFDNKTIFGNTNRLVAIIYILLILLTISIIVGFISDKTRIKVDNTKTETQEEVSS